MSWARYTGRMPRGAAAGPLIAALLLGGACIRSGFVELCADVDCSGHGVCQVSASGEYGCACAAGFRNAGPLDCAPDPETARNNLVLGPLTLTHVSAHGFDAAIEFQFDQDRDAVVNLRHCSETAQPGCDPFAGSSTAMAVDPAGSSFTVKVTGLGLTNDYADVLRVAVEAYDADGVSDLPAVATLTLADAPRSIEIEEYRVNDRTWGEGSWYLPGGFFTSQRSASHRGIYNTQYTDFATMTSEDLSLHRAGNYEDFISSSDGQRLLYHVSFRLFVSDPLGANRVALAADASDWEWKFIQGDTRLAFTAYEGSREIYYTANRDGSDLVRLDYAMPPGETTNLPTFDHAGAFAYFISLRNSNQGSSLYRSAADGSGLVRTYDPSCATCGVSRFELTPDDSTLVLLGDLDVGGQNVLRAIPLDGSGPVTISGSMVAGGGVSAFSLGGDGTQAIFTADREIDGVVELYSVRLDGSGLVKLNGPLVSGGNVTAVVLVPGGERVLYLADQEVAGQNEAYAVHLDGSGLVKVSGANPAGGSLRYGGWYDATRCSGMACGLVTPDGNFFYFTADLDQRGIDELYRASLDGSSRTRINPPLVSATGRVRYSGYYPAIDQVLFFVADDTAGSYALYTANGDGSNRRQIDLPPALAPYDPRYTPDGRQIFLGLTLRGTNETHYVVDADGSDLREVGHDEASIDNDVEYVSVSPDGRWVVFLDGLADRGGDCWDIYRLDVETGAIDAIADSPRDPAYLDCDWDSVSAWNSQEAQFSADSQAIIHIRRYDENTALLYRSALDGLGSESISGPLLPGRSVDGFILDRGRDHAYYWGDLENAGQVELFAVDLSTAASRRLSDPAASTGVSDVALTPDDRRLVFRATWPDLSGAGLWAVDVDGSAPAALTTGLSGITIGSPQVSPDGVWVAFLGWVSSWEKSLYAARLDGSWSGRLVAALGQEQNVTGFAWSGAGATIVYTYDQPDPAPDRLHNAPYDNLRAIAADGSADRALSPPLPYRGRVWSYTISADGGRVAFLASNLDSSDYDLFLVDIDGSHLVNVTAPGKATFSGASENFRARFDAAGDALFFIADLNTVNRWELFRVDRDGSGRAVVSRPLAPPEDVSAFALVGDSDEIVYRVGPVTMDQGLPAELMIARRDGSRQRRLHEPLQDGAQRVGDFELVGDVVLFAKKERLGVFKPHVLRY